MFKDYNSGKLFVMRNLDTKKNGLKNGPAYCLIPLDQTSLGNKCQFSGLNFAQSHQQDDQNIYQNMNW